MGFLDGHWLGRRRRQARGRATRPPNGGGQHDNSAAAGSDPLDLPGLTSHGPLRLCETISFAGLSHEDLLNLALKAGWPEQHPIANALAAAATEHGLKPDEHEVDNQHARWHISPGRGIQGYVNGYHVLIGNERLMRDAGMIITPELRQQFDDHAERGWQPLFMAARTPTDDLLATRSSLLGALVLAPVARPVSEAPSAEPPVPPASERAESPPPGQNPFPRQQYASTRSHTPGSRSRPGRRVAGVLILLSALAGLYGSSFRVAPGELAVVHRLGRAVDVYGPGLHFRWLWPVESITRLPAGAIQSLHLRIGEKPGLGGSELNTDASTAPASPPYASTQPAMNFWVLDAAQLTAGALLRARPIAVEARVQYRLAISSSPRLGPDDAHVLLAGWAEAALREAVAATPGSTALAVAKPAIEDRFSELLTGRLTAAPCGLELVDAVILDLDLSEGGPAARVRDAVDALESAVDQRRAILGEADSAAGAIIHEAQRAANDMIAAAKREGLAQLQAAHAQARRIPETSPAGDAAFHHAAALVHELLQELPPERLRLHAVSGPDYACRLIVHPLQGGDPFVVPVPAAATRPALSIGDAWP